MAGGGGCYGGGQFGLVEKRVGMGRGVMHWDLQWVGLGGVGGGKGREKELRRWLHWVEQVLVGGGGGVEKLTAVGSVCHSTASHTQQNAGGGSTGIGKG
jgi:hypothetical protein